MIHFSFFDFTALRTFRANRRPPLLLSIRILSQRVSRIKETNFGSVISTLSFVNRTSVMKYFVPNTLAIGAQKSSSPSSATSVAPITPSGCLPSISASLKRFNSDFGNNNPIASIGSCIYSAHQMESSVSSRSSW